MTFGNRAGDTTPLIHKPMRRAWVSIVTWSIVLIISMVSCFLLGCGTETKATAEAVTQPHGLANKEAYAAMRNKLVGVWLGKAQLDRTRLTKLMEPMPRQSVAEISHKADYFTGTLMAIEFRHDGTLENEIEITPPGEQPISATGFGTWHIVDADDRGIVVEIAEHNRDGSITTSRKTYQFYEDGDHFAVSIPLESVLAECNPLIIFERQYLDQPQGSLAEANGETVTK